MRVIPVALLPFLLFGCASLPPPAREDAKVIAVYFKPGDLTAGAFKSTNYYLTVEGVDKPFWLRTGLNYIPLNAGTDSTTVRGFKGSADINGKSYTWFSESVYFPVKFPQASSLALVQMILTTHEVKNGNSYRLYGDIREMPDQQAQGILEEWRKEKSADLWTNLFIATR